MEGPQERKKSVGLSEEQREAERKRSKKDAAAAVKICRRFLTALGVWPIGGSENATLHFIKSSLLQIFNCFCLGVRTIPTIVFICFDAKGANQILNLISRSIFCGICLSKYFFLRFHQRAIEKCIREIERDWMEIKSPSVKDIFMEHARYGHLVTKICTVFTYTAATWQASLPYVLKKSAAAASVNGTRIVTPRTFPVPSHFGLAIVTKTPIYEFLYTSQMLGTLMMHSINIACYSIGVMIVMHACAQLKVLMEKIENLVDGDQETSDGDDVDSRLSNIVRYHVKTLRFITDAEKMMREICLIDIGGCTIVLCFLGYFEILEWKAERRSFVGITVYLTLFVTFIFNLFSFCYIGELLTQESTKVSTIAYAIDWYRLPGKQPLALCLILSMAHSPVTLTAGGFTQLSFRCFASVIKTSVGYLNMLRTVMD